MASQTTITKRQAVEVFGTQTALARALGITKGAVCHWDDDDPIPQEHALRLRYEIAPESFKKTA